MEIRSEPRIVSLDILRGVIIILMALDHTRHFFHIDAASFDPEDLTRTSTGLFLTRWITHFCAPGFALLSGISIFLHEHRKSCSKKDISKYLLIRGILLVLLEVTIIRFAWRFKIDYTSIGALVIWALGWCMVLTGLLIFLNRYFLMILGLLIIGFHNLLDNVHVAGNKFGALLFAVFHEHKYFEINDQFGINILYPILPVFGIMLIGYGMGALFLSYSAVQRKKILLLTGAWMITLFIIIRGINSYGDPSPWGVQYKSLFTFFSFLNTTKYPMSLDYCLMTIGPLLLILGMLESLSGIDFFRLRAFGKEPLFFYIIHLYLLHFLALITALVLKPEQWLNILKGDWNIVSNGYGFNLVFVYLIWLSVLFLLYPLCKNYSIFKAAKKRSLFSYI